MPNLNTMLTGLLYAAVVAMWAVVLIPRWLGASDRYRETRSVQRFRHSLRSVRPRRSHRSHDVSVVEGKRVGRVDTSPADSAIDDHLNLGIDPFAGSREDAHRQHAKAAQTRREAVSASARRRRRITSGLVAATVVTTLLMLVGMMSPVLPVLSALALGGFVYLVRTQVANRDAAARAAAQASRPATARSATQEATNAVWEPVHAPEPSYLRAPRATSFPREIDSTVNGEWTSERMLEQAAALRTGQDIDEELGTEEYAHPAEFSPARAVNE